MTHLEILCKAFDEIGYSYLKETKNSNDGEWTYIVLCDKETLTDGTKINLITDAFFEFEPDGSWASFG